MCMPISRRSAMAKRQARVKLSFVVVVAAFRAESIYGTAQCRALILLAEHIYIDVYLCIHS